MNDSTGNLLDWVNRAEEDYQLSRISLQRKVPYTVAQPTVDEAKEALQIGTNIRRFARKLLGL